MAESWILCSELSIGNLCFVITFTTSKKKKKKGSNTWIALQMSMPIRQCRVPYISPWTVAWRLELMNIVLVSRLCSWSKTSIYVWVLPDNHDWPIISVNKSIWNFYISIATPFIRKVCFRFSFGNQIQDLARYLNGLDDHGSISNYSFPFLPHFFFKQDTN